MKSASRKKRGGGLGLTVFELLKSADLLEKSLRLVYLDDAWTAASALSHGVTEHDLVSLQTITDEMQNLLSACARDADWIQAIVVRAPKAFEKESRRLLNQAAELESADPRVFELLISPAKLARMVEGAATQLPREANQLTQEMRKLSAGESTEGDMTAKGRCVIYGLAAIAAVLTGAVVVAAAAGFAIGAECL